MNWRATFATLASAAFLAAAACGDDNGGDGDDSACSVSVGPSDLVGSVAYTASGTGNGTLTQIRYVTDEGELVDNNPTLPFSVTVENSTAKAEISGTGSASNGGSVTVG